MKKLSPPGYFSHLSIACAESVGDGQIEVLRAAIQGHSVRIDEYVDDDHTEKKTISSHVFEQLYTIAVPVELEDAQGNRERSTRLQLQRRIRIIEGSQVEQYKELPLDVATVPAKDLQFFKPNHTAIMVDDAITLLESRSPVILIWEDKPLDVFYQHMINPSVVIILDAQGLIPKLVSTQAV